MNLNLITLPFSDARANSNAVEWEANTPAQLLAKLPGIYYLLTNNPTSMKMMSSSGVLPGSNSASGATGTYQPSSQSCQNGCGLDGSGCGSQGNSDIDPCQLAVPTPPTAPPPTPPTGGELNGEEACENRGYTQPQCLEVGDGRCCQWDNGECWSGIGQNVCPGTGTPTAPVQTPAPVTAPVQTPAPVTAPVRTPAPVTAPVQTPAPVPPTAPPPTPPTGGELNGEEACENRGYTQPQCLEVGDGRCCQWDDGECWSRIGQNVCVTAPTPTPPVPSTSCSDASVRFKVWHPSQEKFITRDCIWVSNRPFRCGWIGVSLMCPSTCDQCANCQDSESRFKVEINGQLKTRDCNWVRNRSTNYRCGFDGVSSACQDTCGTCTASIFA